MATDYVWDGGGSWTYLSYNDPWTGQPQWVFGYAFGDRLNWDPDGAPPHDGLNNVDVIINPGPWTSFYSIIPTDDILWGSSYAVHSLTFAYGLPSGGISQGPGRPHAYNSGARLSIGTGGIKNLSSSTQGVDNPLLSTSQTWNASYGDLGFGYNSYNSVIQTEYGTGPADLTIDGGHTTTILGLLSGSINLTKRGAGSLLLRFPDAGRYGGIVSVQEGTLVLNSFEVTMPTTIILNGGTVTLGPSTCQIDWIGTACYDNVSEDIGELLVNNDAKLELHPGGTKDMITISNAMWNGGILTIRGWTASLTNGATDDRIFINNPPDQAFLQHVQFEGFEQGARVAQRELLPGRGMEMLDAVTFQQDGLLPLIVSAYTTGGQTRQGVVADGVSKLILRACLPTVYATNASSNLHFDLVGGSTNGSLRSAEDTQWASNVPASIAVTNGSAIAVCLYQAPLDFAGVVPPATVRLLDGDNVIAVAAIDVKRPPVVLVHGIWSNPYDAWVTGGAKTYMEYQVGAWSGSGFTITLADYGSSSSERFDKNVPPVFTAISQAIASCTNAGYACSQADVVAHSMGGLLSRLEYQRFGHQGANFCQGNIHKLITIGTPHHGSFLADNAVWMKHNWKNAYLLLSWAGEKLGTIIDRGAVDNMSQYIGDTVLPGILPTAVASHAVSSAAWALDPDSMEFKLYYLLPVIFCDIDPRVITSDAVVDIPSQEDNLPPGGISRYGGAQHTRETSNTDIQRRVAELLNLPISGHFAAQGFGRFAGSPLPSVRPKSLDGDIVLTNWLELVCPTNGQMVEEGAPVSVLVRTTDNQPADSVLFMLGDQLFLGGLGRTNYSFTCPTNVVGDVPLIVTASRVNGEVSLASATIRVHTSETLISLYVYPDTTVSLVSSQNTSLRVTGVYLGGAQREVTAASAGTTYASSDESRVKVDNNGVLTAVQNTTTPVIISIANGSASEQVQVSVNMMDFPPSAVITASCTNGLPPLAVLFDGTFSSDPGSRPLTYLWHFDDGDTSSDPKLNHTFVQPGQHLVELTVTDTLGLMGQDAFTVTVAPLFDGLALSLNPANRQASLILSNAQPGYTYELQASGNLVQWSSLGTNIPNTLTNWLFVDTNAPALDQRYYRVLGIANPIK
jgi:hypothetical protein